mmetsp:Transcript_10788/g.26445  ORF Transcript_10788/g.26445 Transcript_10788/m.26445 type:complete len:1186 (-) Transcript_10788:117-3674(-)
MLRFASLVSTCLLRGCLSLAWIILGIGAGPVAVAVASTHTGSSGVGVLAPAGEKEKHDRSQVHQKLLRRERPADESAVEGTTTTTRAKSNLALDLLSFLQILGDGDEHSRDTKQAPTSVKSTDSASASGAKAPDDGVGPEQRDGFIDPGGKGDFDLDNVEDEDTIAGKQPVSQHHPTPTSTPGKDAKSTSAESDTSRSETGTPTPPTSSGAGITSTGVSDSVIGASKPDRATDYTGTTSAEMNLDGGKSADNSASAKKTGVEVKDNKPGVLENHSQEGSSSAEHDKSAKSDVANEMKRFAGKPTRSKGGSSSSDGLPEARKYTHDELGEPENRHEDPDNFYYSRNSNGFTGQDDADWIQNNIENYKDGGYLSSSSSSSSFLEHKEKQQKSNDAVTEDSPPPGAAEAKKGGFRTLKERSKAVANMARQASSILKLREQMHMGNHLALYMRSDPDLWDKRVPESQSIRGLLFEMGFPVKDATAVTQNTSCDPLLSKKRQRLVFATKLVGRQATSAGAAVDGKNEADKNVGLLSLENNIERLMTEVRPDYRIAYEPENEMRQWPQQMMFDAFVNWRKSATNDVRQFKDNMKKYAEEIIMRKMNEKCYGFSLLRHPKRLYCMMFTPDFFFTFTGRSKKFEKANSHELEHFREMAQAQYDCEWKVLGKEKNIFEDQIRTLQKIRDSIEKYTKLHDITGRKFVNLMNSVRKTADDDISGLVSTRVENAAGEHAAGEQVDLRENAAEMVALQDHFQEDGVTPLLQQHADKEAKSIQDMFTGRTHRVYSCNRLGCEPLMLPVHKGGALKLPDVKRLVTLWSHIKDPVVEMGLVRNVRDPATGKVTYVPSMEEVTQEGEPLTLETKNVLLLVYPEKSGMNSPAAWTKFQDWWRTRSVLEHETAGATEGGGEGGASFLERSAAGGTPAANAQEEHKPVLAIQHQPPDVDTRLSTSNAAASSLLEEAAHIDDAGVRQLIREFGQQLTAPSRVPKPAPAADDSDDRKNEGSPDHSHDAESAVQDADPQTDAVINGDASILSDKDAGEVQTTAADWDAPIDTKQEDRGDPLQDQVEQDGKRKTKDDFSADDAVAPEAEARSAAEALLQAQAGAGAEERTNGASASPPTSFLEQTGGEVEPQVGAHEVNAIANALPYFADDVFDDDAVFSKEGVEDLREVLTHWRQSQSSFTTSSAIDT